MIALLLQEDLILQELYNLLNSHSLGNKTFWQKKWHNLSTIWDPSLPPVLLSKGGFWWPGGAGHHCVSFLFVWQLEGRGWPGFGRRLWRWTFGRKLSGDRWRNGLGKDVWNQRWWKVVRRNLAWKVTEIWSSEWKFATFHDSFLWSRIFPSIGWRSNWYKY